MAQLTIIAPTGDAVTTEVVANACAYKWVVFSAKLAGAEEVDIMKQAGPHWVVATGKEGNVAKLTASIPSLEMTGGVTYGLLKDATADIAGLEVGVYMDVGPGINS